MKDDFLSPFDEYSKLPPVSSDKNANIPDDKFLRSDGDAWLLYASISVLISYFLSIVYMHFCVRFCADYNIPAFFRILNSAISLHLLLICGIIFSYGCFSVTDNWQKDFFFKDWKPLYIVEALGLELISLSSHKF